MHICGKTEGTEIKVPEMGTRLLPVFQKHLEDNGGWLELSFELMRE